MAWSCTEISVRPDHVITNAHDFNHYTNVLVQSCIHLIILVYTCLQRLGLRSPSSFSKKKSDEVYQFVSVWSCLAMGRVGLMYRLTLSSWHYLWPFLATVRVEIEQRQNVISYENQNYQKYFLPSALIYILLLMLLGKSINKVKKI